jgi:hypothetical protein
MGGQVNAWPGDAQCATTTSAMGQCVAHQQQVAQLVCPRQARPFFTTVHDQRHAGAKPFIKRAAAGAQVVFMALGSHFTATAPTCSACFSLASASAR